MPVSLSSHLPFLLFKLGQAAWFLCLIFSPDKCTNLISLHSEDQMRYCVYVPPVCQARTGCFMVPVVPIIVEVVLIAVQATLTPSCSLSDSSALSHISALCSSIYLAEMGKCRHLHSAELNRAIRRCPSMTFVDLILFYPPLSPVHLHLCLAPSSPWNVVQTQ